MSYIAENMTLSYATRPNWIRKVYEMKWAVVVKGWVYRVLGGQGVGLQGPRRSRGMPRGSKGQGVGLGDPRGGHRLRSLPFLMSGQLSFNFF